MAEKSIHNPTIPASDDHKAVRSDLNDILECMGANPMARGWNIMPTHQNRTKTLIPES